MSQLGTFALDLAALQASNTSIAASIAALPTGTVTPPPTVTFLTPADQASLDAAATAAQTNANALAAIVAAAVTNAPTPVTTPVAAPGAPVFTSSATATIKANSGNSFTVVTTGSPTASFAFTGTLPAGVTFHDNGNGTATIGTTNNETPGTSPLVITATNANGSTVQNFTLFLN